MLRTIKIPESRFMKCSSLVFWKTTFGFHHFVGVWRREERDGYRDEGSSWRRSGDRDGPPRRGKIIVHLSSQQDNLHSFIPPPFQGLSLVLFDPLRYGPRPIG